MCCIYRFTGHIYRITGRIYSFIGPIYHLPLFAPIGKKLRKKEKFSILARRFSTINYLLIDISEIEFEV